MSDAAGARRVGRCVPPGEHARLRDGGFYLAVYTRGQPSGAAAWPSSRCGNTMDHAPIPVASALVVLSMTAVQPRPTTSARARAAQDVALVDGHNDYPWALREHDPAPRSRQARHPQAAAVDHEPTSRA
jgi:hypothetical protein